GERYSSYRLLRSVKNRFGTTDEVSYTSYMLLSLECFCALPSSGSPNTVISFFWQALCVSDPSAARHANGIKAGRADMIISVLMKQAGLKLQGNKKIHRYVNNMVMKSPVTGFVFFPQAIFLNVVSGYNLTETAGDLAIAAAICSRYCNTLSVCVLNMVPRMDKRIIAVAKLGFKRCVIPKAAERTLASLNLELTILGCNNLKDVINMVFQPA
ncbi:hypothetical protein BHM03_00033076, partial [Ensete ventricosum]